MLCLLLAGFSHLYAGEPYKDSKRGFSIEFPEGWQITESFTEAYLVEAYYEDDAGHVAFITMAAEDLSETFDPWSKPGKALMEALTTEQPGATILDSGQSIIGGAHAIWTKADANDSPSEPMIVLSHQLVHDRVLYRIEGGTTGDVEWFAKYEETIKEAIHTLSFDGENNRLADREAFGTGDSKDWFASFRKGFGTVLVELLIMTVILAGGGYLLSRSKKYR
ncbi:MAG: hypothetical protein GY809_24325 [Planctomycetes bacterium]|nr:hypothetical protein [Planctomycetota bacterium]